MDNLRYRSSYRDHYGRWIHVYSDPCAPELEAFDEAVVWPDVLVPNNAWLLNKPLPRPVNEKKPRKSRERPEREDRETEAAWGLNGDLK